MSTNKFLNSFRAFRISYAVLFSIILLTLPSMPNILKAQTVSNLSADSKAVVSVEKARFTVLTPRLLRMQWNENNSFDDHASFVVVNRLLPVPEYTTQEKDGWLYITTGELELSYKLNSGSFDKDNLKI